MVVEPTAMAEEMHPGEDMPSIPPALPAAMTVAIPAVRKSSMAVLNDGLPLSQLLWLAYRAEPPKLILTEAILSVLLRVNTCSRPETMSEV